MDSGDKSKNVVWHQPTLTKADRVGKQEYKPLVIWLTGLPSSGKSTIAHELEGRLFAMGLRTYVLDGDNVRSGLNKDLGFSPDDRVENIRRFGEVAGLFVDAGLIVITAVISPYKADRDMARAVVEPGEFMEVYVKCSLEVCKQRDPKGLYKKALSGEIPDFTGVSAPYEPPTDCELTVDTERDSLQESVRQIMDLLQRDFL